MTLAAAWCGSAAFVLALCAPLVLIPTLTRLDVRDVPNERSSHSTPTLRGGGIGQAAALTVSLGALSVSDAEEARIILASLSLICLTIAALGWYEDVRGLSVTFRGAAQFSIGLVITSAVAVSSGEGIYWGIIGAIALVGGVNVANFMDGVNAISAFHGVVAGTAFFTIGLLYETYWLTAAGLVLVASFSAFIPWNIGGRLFLGDVGSYALGGTIAAVVTFGWMQGLPIVALIAPMAIYIADTGVTLVLRIRSHERWYEAHRDHLYQRLHQAGFSHLAVASIVAGLSSTTAVLGIAASKLDGISASIALLAGVLVALSFISLRGTRLAARNIPPP